MPFLRAALASLPLVAVAAAVSTASCELRHGDRCSLPSATLGTYDLMREGATADDCPPTVVLLSIATGATGAEQIRVKASPLTFVVAEPPGFPELAAEPLADVETIALRFDPTMNGIPVTLTISGLVGGEARAAAEVMVVPNARNIVDAAVALETCPQWQGPICSAPGVAYCDGDGVLQMEVCSYGCRDAEGICNACTPGASECQDNVVVVCDAVGDVSSAQSCYATPMYPNRHCEAGECANF